MNSQMQHVPKSHQPRDLLRHYLGDIVYGATDGVITTFAVVSGVVGANLQPYVIIILGIANLFADGFSMGASNYLSIRASSDAEGAERGYYEPLYHASTTFFSFVILGAIPLIAFLVPRLQPFAFEASSIMSATTLFLVGSLRSIVSPGNWLKGGLEMLIIGMIAATVAFGLGNLLGKLVI